MKRKTNLFYNIGNDSTFITFSNYTEAMTGNFLATDIKLFPSKFLCLNIPSLTIDNRSAFIKKLAAYYENKTAFLRDRCRAQSLNQEERLKLLGYLLDCIYNHDKNAKITFVGQVTEQDYNGIYADTICVIDASENVSVTLTREEQDTTLYEDYSDEIEHGHLYGWTHKDNISGEYKYDGPTEYEAVVPETDGNKKYYYTPCSRRIDIKKTGTPSNISFNCIIPLFDIINIDKNDNTDIIQDMSSIDCNGEHAGIINVPYGIWFAKETVTLTRDGTDYSPSWSLVIGSQFKPFPYSKTPIDDIEQSQNAAAFMTFAQILTRQNSLLNKMSEISSQMTGLNNRLSAVESNINSIATMSNIDGIHKEIVDLQMQIDELKKQTNK